MSYSDNPRVAALMRKGMPEPNLSAAKKPGPKFDAEDIPALIRMATDTELFFNEEDDTAWAAPVHAWRALGELRAPEGIAPLLEVLGFPWEEDDAWDDWRDDYIYITLARIGKEALEPTGKFLKDRSKPVWGRGAAARALVGIAQEYPELRSRCVAVLTEALQDYAHNSKLLNSAIVGTLMDLQCVESLETIREAYAKKGVDQTVVGDIEDVEIELGVRTERSTTRRNYFREVNPDAAAAGLPEEQRANPEGGEVSGEPVRREGPKVGRNDPCPCGSGKKYKKCCLNKER